MTRPPTRRSNAPIRVPTDDVDEIYDVFIAIQNKIQEMSADNKFFIVDNLREAVEAIQEMLERNYLDAANGLSYESYWIEIQDINGKSVLRIAVGTDADGEQLSVYDLDAYDQTGAPVMLTARIEYSKGNFSFSDLFIFH